MEIYGNNFDPIGGICQTACFQKELAKRVGAIRLVVNLLKLWWTSTFPASDEDPLEDQPDVYSTYHEW